jgi:hypothetical protein
MPVWFAPAIFQGLVLAARAAAPHVARLFTQAGATAARAGNGYLSMIISYFNQNGIIIGPDSKIQDIIKLL